MKIYNKFVESKNEPSNKNDIWFDGSVVRLYEAGEWYTVTLSKEALEKLIKYAENVKIFKYVDTLPEIGDPSLIYFQKELSDGGVILVPYVYDGEWKQITNSEVFTGTSPFGFGEAENSAVLKVEYQGYKNKAISQTSIAVGAGNIAGLKGYYINYATATIIYISEVNTELLNSEPSIDSNFINPYEVGDVYSIHYGTNYYNVGKITSINHNKITVDAAVVPTKDAELRYHFYVFDKADKGVIDIGECAYAEGIENKAYNVAAHAEGYGNKSLGKYSHTEGKQNEAYYCAHAEGSNNKSIGNTSHTEGTDNIASNSNAHAEGRYTTASGYASHAEGYGENVNNRTVASGDGSHAEGRFTEASGKFAHAEGEKTKAIGLAAHAEGLQTTAEGQASHVEGRYTYAKGVQSHAEGYGKQDGSTGAFGAYSHSEGQYTTASGNKSHSEGTETNASADSAHAEGLRTAANGMYSHAEGRNTITNNDAEHASGQYNKSTKSTNKAQATQFSIGIGTGTSDADRKNAFEVKQNGDIYIEGVEGRIQDKLNGGSSATPDWNAQKGEEGYIENRTHYLNYNDWVTRHIVVNNGITPKKGWLALDNDSIYVIQHKALNDPYIIYTNTFNDNKTVIINSGPLEVYHVCSNRNHSIEIIDYVYDINEQDFDIKVERVTSTVVRNNLKQLNNAFIPDTIARVDNIPNSIGKGIGSLVQTKEVETFENQAPITENPNEEISVDAIGDNSAVLNGKSHAGAKRALAHGNRTIALGENSHTEGHCTQVVNIDETTNGYAAHAEGYGTVAAGTYSHAEGNKTMTVGANSHSEGADTLALGEASHVEGYFAYTGESSSAPVRPTIEDTPSGGESGGSGITTTIKKGTAAHAEGNYTRAEGNYSHAEGRQCDSIGEGSHAEGTETVANGDYSHTEGNKTITHTEGLYSHAEGISTTVDAAGAHAEGFETHANNECSHAEGHGAVANGIYAHAEGWISNAIGEASHAEGQNTRAHEIGSHAEGNNTDAQGPYSHAEGIGTKTKEGIAGQHVEGYYNKETDSLKVIGCGTSDDDRKNAVEVTQDGRLFVKGIGNYDGTSLEAKDLATVINEGGQGGSSATPDWNAEEGKEGFIKNRTHYYNEKLQYRGEVEASINHTATYVLSPYEYIDKDIYGDRAPDKIKFTGGGTSFTLDFIKEPIPGYNDEEGIQEVFNKRFTIDSNNDIEVRYYYDGNPTYYEGVIIELELIATDFGYQEYITFTTEDYYVDLKQIDGVYIPGTVVKTTPQPLTDADKNQVLTNLGIDPVVWKYMMNPFIIYTEQENPVPDDLLSIIDDNGSLNLNPMILKLIVVKHEHENSEIYNINRVASDGVYYNIDAKINYSNGIFIW